MIRVDDVRARIEERVPVLKGRLENAGAFAQLVKNNRLPQQTPAGFVLPGPLAGGTSNMASAMFIQNVRETVIIVLCVRVSGDGLGGAGVDAVTPLLRDVIMAVCGWGPDDAPGVFELGSGELVGSQDGTVIYQLDLVLDDQLRVL